MKGSDKKWSTGVGNGNILQYAFLESTVDSVKRQKDMTPEDEPPEWKVPYILLGKAEGTYK